MSPNLQLASPLVCWREGAKWNDNRKKIADSGNKFIFFILFL